MQHEILNINRKNYSAIELNNPVSFTGFVEYLEEKVKTDNPVLKPVYLAILQEFYKVKELPDSFLPEQARQYPDLLALIYAATSSLTSAEPENLWALCAPLSEQVIYGTEAFYKLFTGQTCQPVNSQIQEPGQDTTQQEDVWNIYCLILQKIYGITHPKADDNIYEHQDSTSGLASYYQLHLDNRFVHITYTQKQPLPDIAQIKQYLQQENALMLLQKHLPLVNFCFSGFSIVVLTNVTIRTSLEQIRQALLNPHVLGQEIYYQQVIKALANLTSNPNLHFGLLPFFKVNQKLVLDPNEWEHSILLKAGHDQGVGEATYLSLAEAYTQNPKPLFVTLNQLHKSEIFFLDVLAKAGVKQYALLPVFYNQHLTGVLEVYTKHECLSIEPYLNKLEPALPLLAQLFQNNLDQFNQRLEALIKEKFTPLQPSVLWKFNEVAWQYLKASSDNGHKAELAPILFEPVHPLYGAIDIRNSTLERNQALQADFAHQLELLEQILYTLKDKVPFSITDELLYKCRIWLQKLQSPLNSADENKLSQFLGQEVASFFTLLHQDKPIAKPVIEPFMALLQPHPEQATENREKLEQSIQILNKAVLNYLEYFRTEIQASYPSYFETFRSDGIEYDIYLGQALAPDKPFNDWYLKNLRLWQLNAMAAITKLTKALQPQLPKPLQTTQLIYVHAHPIAISFRSDERRFDVEGAYNIRYEIIKKRIDKVYVKNKPERLTQPDKIAIVYYNQREAEEYAEHIQYLQNKGILLPDLEYLDLEELQGVSGLKALRVGVNYEQ